MLFFTVTFLCLLRIFDFTSAELLTRTIDDAFTGSVDGASVKFVGDWAYGPTCTTCVAKPNPASAYGGTWHTTVLPGVSSYVSMKFTGSSITVYGIFTSKALWNTIYTITVDGKMMGTRTYTPPNSSTYVYNAVLYSNSQLAPGDHTVVLTPIGMSMLLFDYFVYGYDGVDPQKESNSDNSSSDNSSSNDSSSKDSSSDNSSSDDSNSDDSKVVATTSSNSDGSNFTDSSIVPSSTSALSSDAPEGTANTFYAFPSTARTPASTISTTIPVSYFTNTFSTPSAVPTTVPSGNLSKSSSHSKRNGIIAGTIIGFFTVVVVVGLLFRHLRKKRRAERTAAAAFIASNLDPWSVPGKPAPSTVSDTKILGQELDFIMERLHVSDKQRSNLAGSQRVQIGKRPRAPVSITSLDEKEFEV